MAKTLIGFAILTATLSASGRELVSLVSSDNAMPLAAFKNETLSDGIIKDIGNALAQRTGRDARFLVTSRKRVEMTLAAGRADILCYALPEWVPGPFDWSHPFIPDANVIASNLTVTHPSSLSDLAGKPTGTVFGYYYPELESLLGTRFIREEAPSMQSNLDKLSAGRMQYAVVAKSTLAYHLHTGKPQLHIHPPLTAKTYEAQCAVSRKGLIGVAELNRAIESLQRDGSIKRILDRYR